jgi:hypothetical protein
MPRRMSVYRCAGSNVCLPYLFVDSGDRVCRLLRLDDVFRELRVPKRQCRPLSRFWSTWLTAGTHAFLFASHSSSVPEASSTIHLPDWRSK